MQKKTIVQALLFCIIAIPLYPASVAFLIIEAGPPREGPTSQQTIIWENNLMEVFFESGHIVTNSPILRLTQRPEDGLPHAAVSDFEDARNGGMDFFVIAVVNHPAPHNVSLRLFRTNSPELVTEQTYTDRAFRTRKEEQDTIMEDIRTFAGTVR